MSSSGGRVDLNQRLECRVCRRTPPNIIDDYSQGHMVCGDCGLVFEGRIIDTRSEWRTFTNDEKGDDPSRVGGAANPLLDGHQLDTVINFKDGGTGVARDLNRTMSKVNQNTSQRNLVQGYSQISMFCDRAALPKIVSDRAKQIFQTAEEKKLMRNKPAEDTVATALYIACRQERVSRTFKEISALTGCGVGNITKCYKVLTPHLGIPMDVIRTEDYLSRFCNHLDLAQATFRVARGAVARIRELELMMGKSPTSVAATVIYIVANLVPGAPTARSLKQVSAVSGAAQGTIRVTMRELRPHLRSILPEELHVHLDKIKEEDDESTKRKRETDATNADAVNADVTNEDATNADAVNVDAINVDANNAELHKRPKAEVL